MRTAPRPAYIDPLGRGLLPCVGRHCDTHTRADKPRSLGSRRRLRSRGCSRSEIDQIRLTLSFALVRPSCPRDARAILQSGTRSFCGHRKAHRGKDRGPPRVCVPLSKSVYRYTAGQRSDLSMAVSVKSVLGGFETWLVL